MGTTVHAQSTVTIYGQLDAAYTHISANKGGPSRTGLFYAGMGSSLLGFMGKEDLGGGMYAGFKVEGGINLDSGTGSAANTTNQATGGVTTGGNPQASGTAVALNGAQGFVFGRYSYINLGGSWGEIRLGRDYAASFWNFSRFDPFGTNGVAAASNVTLNLRDRAAITTGTNVSNAIGYLTPATLGGFFAQGQVFFGENLSNSTANGQNIENSGDGYSLNVGYAAGPLSVAAGYGHTKGAYAPAGNPAGVAARPGDYNQATIAGSYDFGVAKLTGYVFREEVEGGSNASVGGLGNAENKGWLLGVIVPAGAGNIKVSYASAKTELNGASTGAGTGKGKQLGLGYDYSLSKRTTLYTAFSRVKNSGSNSLYSSGTNLTMAGGTADTAVTAYAFGVKHSF